MTDQPREAIINMLWISGTLPWYARLSIATFLAQGHPVYLYAYGDLEGVPRGCTVRDAREVLPREAVFGYRHGPFAGYLSGFANWFRCEILLRDGGWWADTDMLCRRPFRTGRDYVFASQWREGGYEINNNVLFVRDAGSELMQRAVGFCRERKDDVVHTENGPLLLASLVTRLGLVDRVAAPALFNPVHFADLGLLADTPSRVRLVALGRTLRRLRPVALGKGYGVHLYAAYLASSGLMADVGRIPVTSYLARIVERSGVAWSAVQGDDATFHAGAR